VLREPQRTTHNTQRTTTAYHTGSVKINSSKRGGRDLESQDPNYVHRGEDDGQESKKMAQLVVLRRVWLFNVTGLSKAVGCKPRQETGTCTPVTRQIVTRQRKPCKM